MSPGVRLLSDRQVAVFWSKVDRTGDCWLWLGAISGAGYGRLNARGVTVYAHRAALELSGTTIPDGHDVDHICHNRRCVRPEHLRPVTRAENNQNFGGAHSHGSSGIRGVSWHAQSGRWRVTVSHQGRHHHGGFHDDLGDAEAAAAALRNRLFTHNELDRTERQSA